MRFTSIIAAGILAVSVAAQSSTSTVVVTAVSSAANTESSAQAAIRKCLEACQASDVTCQSKCMSVPSPNEDQVNKTTECVADCDQGDGSAAATERFAKCRDDCISKYYFTAGGTPAATGAAGGSGSGSGSGSGASAASATGSQTAATASGSARASGTGSSAATGTDAASSGTSTPNAAPALVGSSVVGVVGIIGALLL
ncbi:hypothetical protein C8034_v005177 [Colletotrichum sidae]|uniref:GPI-anchored CFEM domain protein n=2 Tax=Colletotrichum orbiculare species complex TaxID=2707354 RepID=A0A4R8PLX8_9PEZI|nr:hypothetical protein C8035_v000153 [Colletotrichum spinosum]TEA22815.1 hypothetical protein C8034_v005177 [Colletotrichum sidae]